VPELNFTLLSAYRKKSARVEQPTVIPHPHDHESDAEDEEDEKEEEEDAQEGDFLADFPDETEVRLLWTSLFLGENGLTHSLRFFVSFVLSSLVVGPPRVRVVSSRHSTSSTPTQWLPGISATCLRFHLFARHARVLPSVWLGIRDSGTELLRTWSSCTVG